MRVVVTAPPEPVVDVELAKAHLRVDGDGEDTLIEAYVAAATAHLDGPAGWLGRAIGEQTLELRCGRFCNPLPLPYGPVQSVESVKYIDTNGAEQTADEALYVLNGNSVGLTYRSSWPSLRGDVEGVRVEYVAGYAPGEVPAPIIAAILLMTGDLFASRESTGQVTAAINMSTTVEALLAPYRIWNI